MKRRLVLIAVLSAGVLVLLLWALFPGGGSRRPAPPAGQVLPTPTPAPERQVVLLYPGPDDLLHPEMVPLGLPEELDERVRVLVERLLSPSPAGRLPVAPYPARLEQVFVRGDSVVYVDFTAPETPLGGTSTEVLFAYAVTDSVLLNCPTLRGVQLLFGGREVPTLAGHLDLSRPLALNKRLIAAS